MAHMGSVVVLGSMEASRHRGRVCVEIQGRQRLESCWTYGAAVMESQEVEACK